MLAKGKMPKVLTAAKAGAGCGHSRGERAERLRHKALTGVYRRRQGLDRVAAFSQLKIATQRRMREEGSLAAARYPSPA
jgi:hypothetical protein